MDHHRKNLSVKLSLVQDPISSFDLALVDLR